ncbi:MAG: sulfur carrier protein ThiS [Thalassolituus sp.]
MSGTLKINGKEQPLPEHGNLKVLVLQDLGYPEKIRYVVAVNGVLVPETVWNRTHLNNGDYVDILGAITGG